MDARERRLRRSLRALPVAPANGREIPGAASSMYHFGFNEPSTGPEW